MVESCNERLVGDTDAGAAAAGLGREAANAAAPFAIFWLCSAYEHNVVLKFEWTQSLHKQNATVSE